MGQGGRRFRIARGAEWRRRGFGGAVFAPRCAAAPRTRATLRRRPVARPALYPARNQIRIRAAAGSAGLTGDGLPAAGVGREVVLISERRLARLKVEVPTLET